MECPKILEDAIKELYVAFSGYPLAEDTSPCECCHLPGTNALLHAKPLRQLEWEHLELYATEALTVWGEVKDFKHFLPRIFELLLTHSDCEPNTISVEQVFVRFRYAKWLTWPEEERKAVKRLLQSIWETIRSNPPIEGIYIEIEEWLCVISQCEDDLSPYLNQWREDDRVSAAWALSSLILGSTIAYTGTDHDRAFSGDASERVAQYREWLKSPHRSAWWRELDTQYAQLQEWVRSPETVEQLRRAEAACLDTRMATEFATAQRCLLEAQTTKWEPVYRNRKFQSVYWESSTHRLF